MGAQYTPNKKPAAQSESPNRRRNSGAVDHIERNKQRISRLSKENRILHQQQSVGKSDLLMNKYQAYHSNKYYKPLRMPRPYYLRAHPGKKSLFSDNTKPILD